MKTYKASRKGFINYLIIGLVLLPVFILFLDKTIFTERPFNFLPLLSPVVLVFWFYFDTSYKIENNELVYRCGFLKGRIKIQDINELLIGKTILEAKIKPALAKDGLIVKWNEHETVYIAPKNNNELIADLLRLNPKIIFRQ